MGFRFRRSIKILPGIRVNLGKHSTSISVGGRGAHVTLRSGRTARTTAGIPGSGLSYTEGGKLERLQTSPIDPETSRGISKRGWVLAILLLLVLLAAVINNIK